MVTTLEWTAVGRVLLFSGEILRRFKNFGLFFFRRTVHSRWSREKCQGGTCDRKKLVLKLNFDLKTQRHSGNFRCLLLRKTKKKSKNEIN